MSSWDSGYRWRGRPIETLTRDELLEALKQALDHVRSEQSIWVPPDELAAAQREKNAFYSSALAKLAGK